MFGWNKKMKILESRIDDLQGWCDRLDAKMSRPIGCAYIETVSLGYMEKGYKWVDITCILEERETEYKICYREPKKYAQHLSVVTSWVPKNRVILNNEYMSLRKRDIEKKVKLSTKKK